MKKTIFYLLLVSLFSLALVGCASVDEQSTKREISAVSELKTDQDLLLFSTLSSANILETSSLSNVSYSEEENQPQELEIDMEKVNSYMLMMENIMANGGPIVSSETESDREGFDSMMVITINDLSGNTSSYTIYYSIIVEDDSVEPEVTPEGEEDSTVETVGYKHDEKDEHHDEEHRHGHSEEHDKAKDQFKNHHHGDKEDEVEYKINALAIIDDIEYEVLGVKEIEAEGEEQEVEIEFIIKLDDRYVRIEQEIENDEIEYKYTVFQKGFKITSLKFESSEEFGKTFIKLTTEELGKRETYKFIKGENHIIIKYDSISVTEGIYSYTLFVTSNLDEEGNVVYEYKVHEKDFTWNYHKNNKD